MSRIIDSKKIIKRTIAQIDDNVISYLRFCHLKWKLCNIRLLCKLREKDCGNPTVNQLKFVFHSKIIDSINQKCKPYPFFVRTTLTPDKNISNF